MLLSLTASLVILANAPPETPAPQAPQGVPNNGSPAMPSAAPNSSTKDTAASAGRDCPQTPVDSRQIVICAERPQGYRIDPDILEAKRESRNPGRPVRPGGTVRPDCATVGPVPCMNAGINLLAAAATAAQMAQRLSKGQEVGSMFQTDPQPDEYHLYLMAKARREEEQKEQAALAWKKAHPPSPSSLQPENGIAQPSH